MGLISLMGYFGGAKRTTTGIQAETNCIVLCFTLSKTFLHRLKGLNVSMLGTIDDEDITSRKTRCIHLATTSVYGFLVGIQ
jgi:hypothetical protein